MDVFLFRSSVQNAAFKLFSHLWHAYAQSLCIQTQLQCATFYKCRLFTNRGSVSIFTIDQEAYRTVFFLFSFICDLKFLIYILERKPREEYFESNGSNRERQNNEYPNYFGVRNKSINKNRPLKKKKKRHHCTKLLRSPKKKKFK